MNELFKRESWMVTESISNNDTIACLRCINGLLYFQEIKGM